MVMYSGRTLKNKAANNYSKMLPKKLSQSSCPLAEGQKRVLKRCSYQQKKNPNGTSMINVMDEKFPKFSLGLRHLLTVILKAIIFGIQIAHCQLHNIFSNKSKHKKTLN